MMNSGNRKQRLKPLLDAVPPGFMVDTAWLKNRGIDSKSIHNYVANGWLERVVRGVYRRPLPNRASVSSIASWEIPLLSLQSIMNYDVHLGGDSALDYAGFAHHLNLGEVRRIHFYGHVPSWVKRLPIQTEIVVHPRTLFGSVNVGIFDSEREVEQFSHSIRVWRWPVRTSTPERAILEALDELPNNASFDNLDNIFQGLAMLRPEMLMTLLKLCRSVKVRRLFFVYADKHEHRWRKHLDTSKLDLGSGPRALVVGGNFHPKYGISVPKDLIATDEVMEEPDA